jgi:GNAT superfamily N-acetyltransferase
MLVRNARPDEAALLATIAFESKAWWKYSPAVMAGWRDELVVRLEPADRRPTLVAEVEGEVAGFCQVVLDGATPLLEHLWIRPAYIGRGVGRALLGQAGAILVGLGHTRLLIDAEPNAEGFYRRCGAHRHGEVAAPIDGQPDRVRPQMTLDVTGLASPFNEPKGGQA